jgi:hypothetical protein
MQVSGLVPASERPNRPEQRRCGTFVAHRDSGTSRRVDGMFQYPGPIPWEMVVVTVAVATRTTLSRTRERPATASHWSRTNVLDCRVYEVY